MNEVTLNRKSAEKMLAAVREVTTLSYRPDSSRCVALPLAHINKEGRIEIDLEAEHGYLFGDYYGEFRGGCPWICPELEALAEEHGCYWEWDNPGQITLVN